MCTYYFTHFFMYAQSLNLAKLIALVLFLSIPLSFVHPWIGNALYVLVAFMWLVPDRRIERALEQHKE